MSLDDLIGNDKNKKMIKETIEKQKILHSYLFYGIEGIGKKMFALEFAKMILCQNKNNKPCDICKSCIEFNSKSNPDFIFIEPSELSIKIDQIRQMQKKILEKPVNGFKKVYVIDQADKMTKEAQNSLLKTLEEPQEFVVIILISSDEDKILPTVKSRCTKFFFKELDDQEIAKFIKEKFGDVHLDESMIKLSEGSINKSLKVVEKKSILDDLKVMIKNIELIDEVEIINYSTFFVDNKENINLLLDYMYILFFQKVKNCLNIKYVNSMQIIQYAKVKLLNSNNFEMTIDNMLIKIWGEIHEKNYRS